jgi:LmbE family N-acetylglucosaminyl deacetylase
MFCLQPIRLKKILCLGAHSDDIEIGCGGTLLRLLAEYPHLHVRWIVMSGDEQRRSEALASASKFLAQAGERSVSTHQFTDSYFPHEIREIKNLFHRLAAEWSPDMVFTHRRDDAHQDHRVVAEMTWCAFRDQLVLEYEIPKFEGDLGNPNLYVPLDRRFAEDKVAALTSLFPSQSRRDWFSADTFRSLLRLRGVESNTLFAEGFYCRKIVL